MTHYYNDEKENNFFKNLIMQRDEDWIYTNLLFINNVKLIEGSDITFIELGHNIPNGYRTTKYVIHIMSHSPEKIATYLEFLKELIK